jgi:hypothetical protein
MKTTNLQLTRPWLGEYFRRRRGFGLWKAVVDTALDPPNPFKPGARRLPRAEFLFGASLLTFAVAWSLYFNFVR